jgi:general secretion pathway protein K
MSIRARGPNRGGALLMVLWLSAALSAIAFSVALAVRAEIGRSDTAVEGLRAYYLACGAADRAVNYMMYGSGPRRPDGTPTFWEPGIPLLRFLFPDGEAAVEIVAESSKLNVNRAQQKDLFNVLVALGLPPEQAAMSTQAIMDWRAPAQQSAAGQAANLMAQPTFRPPHASLEQIEELMAIPGITPDLFYGGYARSPQGGLVPRPGLRDVLSVYSSGSSLDINTAEPAVMMAVGVPPQAIDMILGLRRQGPIRQFQMAGLREILGPAAGRFRLGGDKIYTLRSTARMRRADGTLSDLRRTVAMTVQIYSQTSPEGFRILAWQDNASGQSHFDVWPN